MLNRKNRKIKYTLLKYRAFEWAIEINAEREGERVEEYFNNSRFTIFSKFMIIHRLIVVIIGFWN